VKTEDKTTSAATTQNTNNSEQTAKTQNVKTEDKTTSAAATQNTNNSEQTAKTQSVKTNSPNDILANNKSKVNQTENNKSNSATTNTSSESKVNTSTNNDVNIKVADTNSKAENRSEVTEVKNEKIANKANENNNTSDKQIVNNPNKTIDATNSDISKNDLDKSDANTTNNKSTNALNEQEEKVVKQSENYITYSKLNKDVKKYDDLTDSENQLAKDLMEQSKQYTRESEVLFEKSSSIENAEEKKIQIAKSNELKNLAAEMKLKADSVFDLAQNTKAFAESKRMEYDAFIEGLDKDVLNKIKSIAQKDIVAKNKSNGNSGNNGLNSSDEQAANAIQYSESYINKLNALEKEFDRLEAKGKPDVSIEEFEKRNVVINKMIEVINQEVSQINAIASNYDEVKKQDYLSLVSQLSNKKISLENKISDNLTSIKNIKVKETPITVATNSNTNEKSADKVKNEVDSASASENQNNIAKTDNVTTTNNVKSNDVSNDIISTKSEIASNKTNNSGSNSDNQKTDSNKDSNASANQNAANSPVKTVVVENSNKATTNDAIAEKSTEKQNATTTPVKTVVVENSNKATANDAIAEKSTEKQNATTTPVKTVVVENSNKATANDVIAEKSTEKQNATTTPVKTVVVENSNKATTNDDIVEKSSTTKENKQTATNENAKTAGVTNTSINSTSTSKSNLKGKGFEVLNESAYTEAKPIPVDVKLPNGIIFAVQIGAFRNPIPNTLFKGLSPLRGETTAKGLIRYQAGKFELFEDANGVKNDLKKMGYKDAFVVVYKDGNRITLPEAIVELKNKGITVNQDENQTAGITTTANIPPATEIISKMNEVAANNLTNKAPDELRGNTIESLVVSTDVSQVQGLFYTVQVGLFSGKVTASKLYNLNPLFTDKIQSNAFRYTAGIYTSLDRVKTDRLKVVDLGIKDAFVSAYLNGQRIKISDALSKINAGEKFVFPTEQPIRFSSLTNVNAVQPIAQNQPVSENTNANSTVDNSSSTEKGIVYKIQIGAYRKQANKEVKNKFSRIKNYKIDTQQINELFVYSAGAFIDMNAARPALESVKQLGIADAFICVYRDGKKLYGEEAAKLMGRR
jgi:hypothetical protein